MIIVICNSEDTVNVESIRQLEAKLFLLGNCTTTYTLHPLHMPVNLSKQIKSNSYNRLVSFLTQAWYLFLKCNTISRTGGVDVNAHNGRLGGWKDRSKLLRGILLKVIL